MASSLINMKSMSKTETMKENAIAFYKMAYEVNPREAVSLYVGD